MNRLITEFVPLEPELLLPFVGIFYSHQIQPKESNDQLTGEQAKSNEIINSL